MGMSLLRRAALASLVACLLPAAQAWALSLGQARGVALMGRALEVVIPLGLDPGSDAGALCLEPEVFYGDTRASAGRVSARIEAVSPTQANARIRSEAPVDEPVVTLYLRVGCSQPVTRRFVLFAEQPSDAVIEQAPAPARAVTAVPVAPLAPAAPPASAAAPSVPAVATSPATVEKTSPAAPRRAARNRGEPNPVPVAKPAKPAQPKPGVRLKLEPLDLSVDPEPRLKSTQAIDMVPEASAQRRAEAAALWQALNAQPEDVMRGNQRLQALEGDVKSLRDAVTRNSASLADVRGELVKARDERYANWLVYGLVLALLTALAAAGWAWRRSRSAGMADGDWWRKSAAGSATTGFDAQVVPVPVTAPVPPATSPTPVPVARAKEPDLGFSESMMETVRVQNAVAKARPPRVPFRISGRGEFADSYGTQAGGLRAVKAEELNDIQQQADFFVSLGEYDRAIEVLRSHIYVNPETSALAWLDLLGIFHRLERREDYDWVRGEFNRIFNAQAPVFDNYGEDDAGLETYQQALSRIVALWPSPRVLEVIDESIFRKPGREGGEAFSLEAYRELLMLHNLAKDVIDAGDAPVDFVTSSKPSDFSHTSLEALSARLMIPAASVARIGLDIDLDEPPAASSDRVPLGEPAPHLPPDNLIDFDLPDSGGEPETRP